MQISVDPDQTPRSAESDLSLHCLPLSHLWDARHKWFKWYCSEITSKLSFLVYSPWTYSYRETKRSWHNTSLAKRNDVSGASVNSENPDNSAHSIHPIPFYYMKW